MNVDTDNDLQCIIALAALEDVIDPEIGLNVVDLGLIWRIDFGRSGSDITVTMTLSTPHCPMGEAITGSVEQALRGTFLACNVRVRLTFDPPWSYERISEAGKRFLSI